jgi:hypothetical protein
LRSHNLVLRFQTRQFLHPITHGESSYFDRRTFIWEEYTRKSLLHWVAGHLGDLDYIRRTLSKTPHLLHSREDLSLLVSVAFSSNGTLDLKDLLELGACPNEQINVKHMKTYRDEDGREAYYKTAYYYLQESRTLTTTVWRAFCACFAVRMISGERERDKLLYCRRLADLVATAQVDTNCVILVAVEKRRREFTGERDYMREPTHVISFRELVQQLDLPNWETLQKLLNSGLGVLATLQDYWRHLRRRTDLKTDHF